MGKTVIPFYATPALTALLLSLAACQTAPTQPASQAPTGTLNTRPAEGSVHYSVDAAHSEVEFLVYKAGALAGLVGHDHTVEAQGFTGEVYLAPAFKDSLFSLTLPVKDFQVDRPEARAAAGEDFKSKPSSGDIQGTTAHMLGADCLDAEKYPEVSLQSVSVAGSESKADMIVRITLHGTTRDLKVPVTVSRDGAELAARGDFELRQSEFGITPFSAAGGSLQVADALKVHFKILARRVAQ